MEFERYRDFGVMRRRAPRQSNNFSVFGFAEIEKVFLGNSLLPVGNSLRGDNVGGNKFRRHKSSIATPAGVHVDVGNRGSVFMPGGADNEFCFCHVDMMAVADEKGKQKVKKRSENDKAAFEGCLTIKIKTFRTLLYDQCQDCDIGIEFPVERSGYVFSELLFIKPVPGKFGNSLTNQKF